MSLYDKDLMEKSNPRRHLERSRHEWRSRKISVRSKYALFTICLARKYPLQLRRSEGERAPHYTSFTKYVPASIKPSVR